MSRRSADLTLLVRHTFHATPEFLFDAWTDPRLMARWFHAQQGWTTDVLKSDLRIDGEWEIVMRTGGPKDCRAFGKYVVIDRPRLLLSLRNRVERAEGRPHPYDVKIHPGD